MKSAAIAYLQVLFPVLVYGTQFGFFGWDEALDPVNLQIAEENRFLGINDEAVLWLNGAYRKRMEDLACYRNIQILSTPECGALQSTDFTEMEVSDFCVGQTVRFSGAVNFRVGMSQPSPITVNVSRVVGDHDHHVRNEEGEPYIDNYVFYEDGCDLMAELICSFVPLRWCGCPIKEGVVVLYHKGALIEEDFLPRRMGFGDFIAHVTLSTPEDSICLDIFFSREKMGQIP